MPSSPSTEAAAGGGRGGSDERAEGDSSGGRVEGGGGASKRRHDNMGQAIRASQLSTRAGAKRAACAAAAAAAAAKKRAEAEEAKADEKVANDLVRRRLIVKNGRMGYKCSLAGSANRIYSRGTSAVDVIKNLKKRKKNDLSFPIPDGFLHRFSDAPFGRKKKKGGR